MPVLAVGHAPLESAPGIAVTVHSAPRIRAPGWRIRIAAAASALVLAACAPSTPSPSGASASPGPPATQTPDPTATQLPTATPIPRLTLPAPSSTDPRAISFTVSVELEANASGRIMVTVENLSGQKVDELVLRWPTELRDTVFLAPFEPSQQRIREGGPPLRQEWTKWVEGPGEHDEPAGTTSLGWGPLLPGGTLSIPVLATRVGPGPISFDLHILAGEAALTSDGEPATLYVSIP